MKNFISSILLVFLTILVWGCSDSSIENDEPFVIKPFTDSSQQYLEGVSLTPTLKWNAGLSSDYKNLLYDLYLDTQNPPNNLVAKNIESNFYTLKTPLESDSTYYWKVVSVVGKMRAESDVFSFKTILPKKLVEISDLSLNENDVIELINGETYLLRIEITPENATVKEVTCSSEDKTIAKVTEKGQIIAVKFGETTIKVSSIDGKHSDSVKIIVR